MLLHRDRRPAGNRRQFYKKGEDFWDNYPSSYNSTISPDDIKLFIGRIFQYGYTGTISTSWRSQNEGGDKLAHAVATQLLIWETVIGERDENFNKVSTGSKDAVLDQISTNHPLYDKIMSYYNSMAASVQKHSKLPSFLSKTPGGAKEIELEWDGSKYTVTLTDTNNVLSGYKFSSNDSGVQFSVSGNKLTITSEKAPSDGLTITAEKTAQRKRRNYLDRWYLRTKWRCAGYRNLRSDCQRSGQRIPQVEGILWLGENRKNQRGRKGGRYLFPYSR